MQSFYTSSQLCIKCLVFCHLVQDPLLEMEYSCKHCVCLLSITSWRSVTYGPMQLPSAIQVANIRTTRVAMTTADLWFSPPSTFLVSSANHGIRDRDVDDLSVLFFAHLAIHHGHGSLLKGVMHTARVFDLPPSGNVTFRADRRLSLRQTCGLHVRVHLHRFR